MRAKAIDAAAVLFGIAFVAVGGNKLAGADVVMRQVDIIAPAMASHLRARTLALITRTRCLLNAGAGTFAALMASIAIAAAMVQHGRLGTNPLALLVLLALGETVVWLRLRKVAHEMSRAGHTPCHRSC